MNDAAANNASETESVTVVQHGIHVPAIEFDFSILFKLAHTLLGSSAFLLISNRETDRVISQQGSSLLTDKHLAGWLESGANQQQSKVVSLAITSTAVQDFLQSIFNTEPVTQCFMLPLLPVGGIKKAGVYLLPGKAMSLQAPEHVQLFQEQAQLLLENYSLKLKLQEQEQQIARKHTLLSIAQDNNKLGTWEFDIETQTANWSDEVLVIHEIESTQRFLLEKAIEFYHPDDRAAVEFTLLQAVNNGIPFSIICRLYTAKGNLRWVRTSGRKVGNKVVGSFQDITEFKNSELKYKGIIDSAFALLLILDPDGSILEVNKNDFFVNNAASSSLLNKKLWATVWWENSLELQQQLQAAISKCAAGQSVTYETKLTIGEDTSIAVILSLRPLINEKGELTYLAVEASPIQEITEVRDRYRFILDSTNLGTWEWNLRTGETVFNERWAEILGYTISELEPISIETWKKLTHEEDLENSIKKIEAYLRGETSIYEAEIRMLHKDGHWVWIYDKGKILEWTPDGQAHKMYGTHQDITERKRKEFELTDQKNILDALYALSPIGIALNNFDTGEFIDVNEKLLEPSGYSKSEFLKLSYWDVTPDSYMKQELLALETLETTGRYGPYEKEFIHKNGNRYPVLLRGVISENAYGQKLIWSFVQDISKEKAAQQKLEEAVHRLESVLNSSTQVSVIATDLQGTITLFNSGAEKMLGYNAADIIGLTSPKMIHLETELMEEAQDIFQNDGLEVSGFDIFVHYAKKGRPRTREWTYVRKDGTTFPVLLSVTATVNDGEITGFLGVATDISDIKQAESEIRSLLEITKHQNATLKNFAHIVSHNLRSHSTGLSGVFDLLMAEQPELEQTETIQYLGKGIANLSQTINELTQVVMINLSQSDKKEVNLQQVITRNIENVRAAIKQHKFVIENTVNENETILAVPAYLDSIVLNFITNAIKYRSPEREGRLKISATRENNKQVITFSDNGLGIDLTKHKDRLFGMYKTFHHHPDSRGVGLFLCKNQMESMGGHIEVESTVNLGTNFKIYFPLL